jgi:hypothetical protein
VIYTYHHQQQQQQEQEQQQEQQQEHFLSRSRRLDPIFMHINFILTVLFLQLNILTSP